LISRDVSLLSLCSYAFCRVADDLVDNAKSPADVQKWITNLNHFLDLKYSSPPNQCVATDFVADAFPPQTHAILSILPTDNLPPQPLYSLLHGFATDLKFSDTTAPFPISTESDLFNYASQVAGTVGELVIRTTYLYTTSIVDSSTRTRCIAAGFRMGVALQYVNIARDIATDAAEGRVYLPTTWLSESNPPLTPKAVIATKGTAPGISALRTRLLEWAFEIYHESRDTIEELPVEARGPIRVAVEGYMEIGRVILNGSYVEDKRKKGRATVPKMRRLWVGWKALNGRRS
jgi:15-cis-phytoene synthase/lycopene beta-cyclase